MTFEIGDKETLSPACQMRAALGEQNDKTLSPACQMRVALGEQNDTL
jgi:hypothetical protein